MAVPSVDMILEEIVPNSLVLLQEGYTPQTLQDQINQDVIESKHAGVPLDGYSYGPFSKAAVRWWIRGNPGHPVTKALGLFRGEVPKAELVLERMVQEGLVVELFRSTGLPFKDNHMGGTEHSMHFEHLYPLCVLTLFWDFDENEWKGGFTTEEIEAFVKDNEVYYHRISFDAYGIPHDNPVAHVDFLSATANFDVIPSSKAAEMSTVSDSISVLRHRVTAGCHFMGASIVAIFLAKAVMLGVFDVDEARAKYPKYILKAAMEQVRADALLYSVESEFYIRTAGVAVYARAMPFTRMLEAAVFFIDEPPRFAEFVYKANDLVVS